MTLFPSFEFLRSKVTFHWLFRTTDSGQAFAFFDIGLELATMSFAFEKIIAWHGEANMRNCLKIGFVSEKRLHS